MKKDTISKVTADLKEKYPDIGLHHIEVNEKDGKSSFYLQPNKESLAFLDPEKASIMRRDPIDRSELDLFANKKHPSEAGPKELYRAAIKYYYSDPLVGTTINLLSNLAFRGFENDIDDAKIKNFFDVWAFDVKFDQVLEWIFLDFFKTGHVVTYKAIASYEPRVSHISPIPGKEIKVEKKTTGKIENAARKKIWSKNHLPVAYTVLNPLLVDIDGSLLFDKYSVKFDPTTELREMFDKPKSDLTPEEKELIRALPSDLKRAAEKGEKIKLDSRLVGFIAYRKQPYERYAKPRSTRIFDSLHYKESLRQADISTLDGISNYILKVTIGSDEYPVVTQGELQAVAKLFNTPSKSFDVVWNHTLKVEKIVSPEIEAILGQDKYKQVNEDITGGLAITRAIIDGTGNINASEVSLLIKGLMEEIGYARRQVTRWIYDEYRQIAEAVGFNRFPKIRWDESVLKDTILYMSVISQLVDRRMLSYRTALEALNFDFASELNNMKDEFSLVNDGVFGLHGSPWQQSKKSSGEDVDVQPKQGAPTGTPSAGRPVGQPAKKKQKSIDPGQGNAGASSEFDDIIKNMSNDDYINFINKTNRIRFGNE